MFSRERSSHKFQFLSIIIFVFRTGEEKHWRDSRVRWSLWWYLTIHLMLSSSSTSKQSLSLSYGLTFFRYFFSREKQSETRLKDLFTWTTSTTTCLLHQYLMKKKEVKSDHKKKKQDSFRETRRLFQNKSSRRHLCHYFYFYVIRDHKEIEIETKYVERDLLVLSQDFASRWKRMKLLSLFFFRFSLSLVKDHRDIRRPPQFRFLF